MIAAKLRYTSAKVTLGNRTSAASWFSKVILNPPPDDMFRAEINPSLDQTGPQFSVWALCTTLLCQLVFLSLSSQSWSHAAAWEFWTLPRKMSSCYLWIRKKSQKAEDIKKKPSTYSFESFIICKTPEWPHTLRAIYSLEPNLHLPTRHPEKTYCQPSSRALETGFQRDLDTWMPLRSWPWVLSRLYLAWWVAD